MATLDELAGRIEDEIVGSLDVAQIAAQLRAHSTGAADQLLAAALTIVRRQRHLIETLERTLDDASMDRDNLENEIQELEVHLKRQREMLDTVHWASWDSDQ